jgi:hypothetical protein
MHVIIINIKYINKFDSICGVFFSKIITFYYRLRHQIWNLLKEIKKFEKQSNDKQINC